jgi:hypothetical protein
MKDTSCLLLSVVVGLAAGGCLIDRGPLPPGGEEDAGPEETDAETDAFDPDAFVEPMLDADLDAASEPDAFRPDAYVDDAFRPPDAFEPCTSVCDGDALVTCAGRSTETREDCKLGCGETPAPHCRSMLVSNLRSASIFDTATSDFVVTGEATIDTTTMGTRRVQRDGSEVSVLVYGRIDVGGTLTVVGPVPLLLIARDGITVGGTIDVSAVGGAPGPGGRAGASTSGGSASGPGNGRGGGHEGDWEDGGGGGGGQCGTGGRGGDASPTFGSTARGGDGGGTTDAAGDPETLRGGGGGGAGNGDGGRFGVGGAGGGALQLSSRGTITIGGYLRARGSTGGDGRSGSGNDGSGGGGGAGGWILVEAPSVLVGGTLDASGGNGGSGDGGGGGGAGGAASSNGSNGGNDSGGGANGGGGGGGAGCIVIRTHDPFSMMGTLSPRDATGLRTLPILTD